MAAFQNAFMYDFLAPKYRGMYRYHRDTIDTVASIANFQPGQRVLDVACGTGMLSTIASRAIGPNGHIVGLDISPASLAIARGCSTGNMTILTKDMNDPSLANDATRALEQATSNGTRFDIITCIYAGNYVSSYETLLRRLLPCLAPQGRLIFDINMLNSNGARRAVVFDAFAISPAHQSRMQQDPAFDPPYPTAEHNTIHHRIWLAGDDYTNSILPSLRRSAQRLANATGYTVASTSSLGPLMDRNNCASDMSASIRTKAQESWRSNGDVTFRFGGQTEVWRKADRRGAMSDDFWSRWIDDLVTKWAAAGGMVPSFSPPSDHFVAKGHITAAVIAVFKAR